MQVNESSVSPKGQIIIPADVRRRLGIKPKDKVSLQFEGDQRTVRPGRSRLETVYQSVPALERPFSDREVTDLAWEEHAGHVAQEGQ